MAWERRRQGTFYYRAKRIGGHVQKTYCGNGAMANLVAHQDELRKVQRASAAQSRLKARRRLESVDLALDGLGEIVDVIAEMEPLETKDEKTNQENR